MPKIQNYKVLLTIFEGVETPEVIHEEAFEREGLGNCLDYIESLVVNGGGVLAAPLRERMPGLRVMMSRSAFKKTVLRAPFEAAGNRYFIEAAISTGVQNG